MADYECSMDIRVLRSFEAVRCRPGMYVGDTRDGSGLHHMLWSLVHNGIDEHHGGTASYVRVRIDGATCTIEDDGRGIPVDPMPREPALTALELVFTRLGITPAREPRFPSGRRRGLSLCSLPVVTALSERLDVEVFRGGRRIAQAYARGEPLGPPRDEGPTECTGTRITFTPDATIFQPCVWDLEAIALHLRELAALHPRLTFTFQNDAFRAPDGLGDHARYLAQGDAPLHREPIRLAGTYAEVDVQVGLLWTASPRTRVVGLVNERPAPAGHHVRGLHFGLRRAFRRVVPERLRGVYSAAFREVIDPGLVAIVHVAMDDPYFVRESKHRTGSEALNAVRTVVGNQLAAVLRADADLLQRLLARMPG